MPTIQPVNLGGAAPAQAALDMRAEYENFIAITNHMLALLQRQHADQCENFNRWQSKCQEALRMADATIAQRAGDPAAHKELLSRRENFVANFSFVQARYIAFLQGLEAKIAEGGEALHFLIRMAQGSPAPQAATGPQPQQQAQAPQPNTVEASAPPQVASQVAEVIEANGQRTIFENGQPVAVVPPSPGATQNNSVIAEGGGQVVHGNGVIPS